MRWQQGGEWNGNAWHVTTLRLTGAMGWIFPIIAGNAQQLHAILAAQKPWDANGEAATRGEGVILPAQRWVRAALGFSTRTGLGRPLWMATTSWSGLVSSSTLRMGRLA